MTRAQWSQAWDGLRTQWQINTRLRWGLWVIGGILWVYALLLLGDRAATTRQASAQVGDEIDRLRSLSRSNPWPARVEEARQQLAALRSMVWNDAAEGRAADAGLAEAALQDWLRSTAVKAGLRVRELTVARAGATPVVTNLIDAAPAGGPLQLPAVSRAAVVQQAQLVKVRLSLEAGRNELLAFLAEVGRYERVVVVERLLFRPGSAAAPLASAELDLRIVASTAGGTR
jgi:hypothetical protein